MPTNKPLHIKPQVKSSQDDDDCGCGKHTSIKNPRKRKQIKNKLKR